MSPLCSRNARSQKTLVGRAQWRAQSGHPGRTATSKLGRAIVMCLLRPCLGQDASRRVRVGRVRSLALFSILRRCCHRRQHGRFQQYIVCKPSFSAACYEVAWITPTAHGERLISIK
jgi:hypothetical protein